MNEPTFRPAAAPDNSEPANFRPVNFASDNVTGIAPEIVEAIVEANEPQGAWPYGNDEVTGELNGRFSALFDTAVSVYPVATGTAANALCLSLVARPFNTVYCLKHSHAYEDEGGAPEFYTNGAKLVPVPAADGKMTAAALEAAIGEIGGGGARLPHVMEAAAVSIAQATECGTVYSVDEIRDIWRGRAGKRSLRPSGRRALRQCGRRPRLQSVGDSPGGRASILCLSARPKTAPWRRKRWCCSTKTLKTR